MRPPTGDSVLVWLAKAVLRGVVMFKITLQEVAAGCVPLLTMMLLVCPPCRTSFLLSCLLTCLCKTMCFLATGRRPKKGVVKTKDFWLHLAGPFTVRLLRYQGLCNMLL